MGKRRSTRVKSSTGRGFGISTASPRLPPLFFTQRVFSSPSRLLDNRLFHPLPPHRAERVFLALSNYDRVQNQTIEKFDRRLLSKRYFKHPQFADPCKRRRDRREVMFAFNQAGRRFGSGGRVRRTPSSSFSCR